MTMMLTKDGRNALSVEVLRQVPLECMSNTQLAQWNLLVKKGEPPKDKDPDAVRNALSRFNANPGVHRATSLGWKAVSRIARENARKEREEEDVGGERQQTATTKDRRPPVCGKEDVMMATPQTNTSSTMTDYQRAAAMGVSMRTWRFHKKRQEDAAAVVAAKARSEAKVRREAAARGMTVSQYLRQQEEQKVVPINGEDTDKAFQEGRESFEEAAKEYEPEPEPEFKPVSDMTKRLSAWASGVAAKPELAVHKDRIDAVSRGLTVRSADWPSKVLHDIEQSMDDDGIDRRRLIQLAHVIEGLPEMPVRDPGLYTSAPMSHVRSDSKVSGYMVRGGGANGLGARVFPRGTAKEAENYLTGFGLICWGWGGQAGTRAVVQGPKRAAELHEVLVAEPVVCRDVGFPRRVKPRDVARALCHWMDGATPAEAYRKVRDHEASKTRDDWNYGGAGVVLPGSRTHQMVQPEPEPEPEPISDFEEVLEAPTPEETEQALTTAMSEEAEGTEDRLAKAREEVESCREMLAEAEAGVAELEVLVKAEAEERERLAAEAEEKAREEARKTKLVELLGTGLSIEDALKAL